MCTLIVEFRQHPDVPVLVAANRDEVRSRPATGPRRWPGERFIAPRDEQAHGTWLGLTDAGLFVGVTNRFPAERHTERRSRGALVVDALRASSAEALHQRLARLDPGDFNAFHLLYLDPHGAFVTWSDGERLTQAVLAPGLHVVTERSLGGDDRSRTGLIRAAWPGLTREGGLPTPEALFGLLGRARPDDPLGGVCVDVPQLDYGTRSSLVLFLHRQLYTSRFFWAEGPPDRAPFVERAELIAELAGPRVGG
jgi:uncharacterized protein with NRDE domain